MEWVSATGQALTLLISFKAQSIQAQWFGKEFKRIWRYTNLENGWTSNNIALE
jgi:hypothetical protein